MELHYEMASLILKELWCHSFYFCVKITEIAAKEKWEVTK